MEFPDLGAHCSLAECRQLDFLPIKCHSCQKTYCKNHYAYERHGCTQLQQNQVPICPLCNALVPITNRDQPADVFVEEHILTNCSSQPAKAMKGKIFNNKCSYPKCPTKETIKITCYTCKKVYCIRHRLESDHKCGQMTSLTGKQITKFMIRSSDNKKEDDDAKRRREEEDYRLALALHESINNPPPPPSNRNTSYSYQNNQSSQSRSDSQKCNQM